MDEKRIQSLMTSLKCTREEAISVIMDDEEVDHMTMKEVTSDMTAEQKKAAKAATITTGDKKKRAYNFKPRERKPDEVKREIIETIAQNLNRCCFGEELSTVVDVIVLKPEKEITFTVDGEEYSVTLTKHRKPKGE